MLLSRSIRVELAAGINKGYEKSYAGILVSVV